MRFAIIRVVQKSNSFSRRATSWESFNEHEFLRDGDVVERYGHTNTVVGGFLAGARERTIETAPMLSLEARSGLEISSETLEKIEQAVTATVAEALPSVDGILVELSGALATDNHRSADEAILAAIRSQDADIPICLVLSSQANLTERIGSLVNVILSPIDNPPTDASDLGRRAIARLESIVEDRLTTEVAVSRVPLILPLAAQRPELGPVGDVLERVRSLSVECGVTEASVFWGYPHTDVPHAGATIAITAAAGHPDQDHATEIREFLWERRGEFFVPGRNVEEAIHDGMAAHEGMTLITDLGDNPDDGAPGDGTTVLWALIDLGVRDAVLASIADERAVAACRQAGVGANVEIPVGGRYDSRHGYPIDVRGTVTNISSGRFQLSGPVRTGLVIDAGTTVVLDLEARHEGRVTLVLTERPVQITDTGFFEHIGINVTEHQIVSIKSTIDYRPAFDSVASQIYEVITPGITTPDPAFYEYQHIHRPIYPLDQI